MNLIEKHFALSGLTNYSQKIQRRNFINDLGYKIGTKDSITDGPNQERSLNDFQKLLGNINWLGPIIRLTTQEINNLFQSYRMIKTLVVQENY